MLQIFGSWVHFAWSSKKPHFCRTSRIPLIIHTILRATRAQKHHAAETLIILSFSKHVPSISYCTFRIFRPPLLQKKTLFCETCSKSKENQLFWTVSDRLGMLSGASLEALGAAWGCQGAIKRRLEDPFAFWKSSRGLLGPLWAPKGRRCH